MARAVARVQHGRARGESHHHRQDHAPARAGGAADRAVRDHGRARHRGRAPSAPARLAGGIALRFAACAQAPFELALGLQRRAGGRHAADAALLRPGEALRAPGDAMVVVPARLSARREDHPRASSRARLFHGRRELRALGRYLLAKRFGLPWIAEVHDPMVVEGAGKSRMASRFARWLEGRVCARADVAIWFTDEALARAKARHPELGARGHSLVPGADEPAFHRAPYARGD